MTPAGIPQTTRDAVAARSGGTCELCGQAPATQLHHRRPRGMGGANRAGVHHPAGLLHVDDTCHQHAETHRAHARRNGWLVPQGTDPATVPVRMWHGWVTPQEQTP